MNSLCSLWVRSGSCLAVTFNHNLTNQTSLLLSDTSLRLCFEKKKRNPTVEDDNEDFFLSTSFFRIINLNVIKKHFKLTASLFFRVCVFKM